MQVRRDIRRMRAREAAGEEYERLWRMVVAAYPATRPISEWVGHPIPLVVLDPIASPA